MLTGIGDPEHFLPPRDPDRVATFCRPATRATQRSCQPCSRRANSEERWRIAGGREARRPRCRRAPASAPPSRRLGLGTPTRSLLLTDSERRQRSGGGKQDPAAELRELGRRAAGLSAHRVSRAIAGPRGCGDRARRAAKWRGGARKAAAEPGRSDRRSCDLLS